MTKTEFIALLRTAKSFDDFCTAQADLLSVLPELKIMLDYDVHKENQPYNLWEHSCRTVIALPKVENASDALYVAALFHDVGKPDAKMHGTNGDVHYPSHALHGSQLVNAMLECPVSKFADWFSGEEAEEIVFLVKHHDDNFKKANYDFRLLKKQPKNWLIDLCYLEKADAIAHKQTDAILQRIVDAERMLQIANKMKA